MKKPFLAFMGTLLLLPLFASEALGIDLSTFRDQTFRPENLPAAPTSGSAETKIVTGFQFFINLILYASGSIAVLLLVFGGLQYIMALGNQEKVDEAKSRVTNAVIGLLVVILAYAIVTNVIDLIYRATT